MYGATTIKTIQCDNSFKKLEWSQSGTLKNVLITHRKLGKRKERNKKTPKEQIENKKNVRLML